LAATNPLRPTLGVSLARSPVGLESGYRPARGFRNLLISQVPGNLLAFEFPQKRLCFTFDELYCLTHSIAGFPIALSTSLRFGLVAKFSRLLL
jgi:hypothetical protein